jgi:hypothetical protein
MSSGELHAWSCAASGWARRSCLVVFSYALTAALKIDRKFEVDVEVDGI